jgi:hypothetical protein
MTTQAGVGLSHQANARQAGAEAARQALAGLATSAEFIIAFTTDRYAPEEVIQGIRAVTGATPLFGCTAPGIFSGLCFSDDGIAVMALGGEGFKVTLALAEGVRAAPEQAGRMIAERAAETLGMTDTEGNYLAMLALIDAVSGFAAEVVDSMTDLLGPSWLIAGGAGCDNFKFIKSFQFTDDVVRSDALIAAMLRTPAPIGVGVSHGYLPVDRPLVVTRSASNIIYELDGQPAFEVYRRAWANEIPALNSEGFAIFAKAHPLGLPQLRGEYVIRDLVRVHPNGAIECVSTVPENAVVHMMKVDRAGLLQAARAAAEQAMAGLAGRPPAAVLIFDCVSRLTVLGEDKTAEIHQIQEVVGCETPLIGMFSFGEIATPPQGGLAAFYNKTVVVCVLT